MKITNNKHAGVVDTLLKSVDNKTVKEQATDMRGSMDVTDKVELSGNKKIVESLVERVKAIPDVRQDKVDQIRQAIKSETYNVKGELVAKSILKSNILDTIL
ncbi:MAG TPA: flagellar biosynthesis anti-sigma factor FlgM [Syntrophorhabdaceae bacterium]|jgi:negative regulator of flagellin synthesis FlgM|nr:flagellar biosynthesis anti-sigma factor FlgM [Syntrophorhabdaceae bacterium]MDI9560356.1 flagellar biosynthesis anti-sigma factor FlgM [Pseudomonadota bacterium]OQC48137.1 MAG: Anti-sigma-28 factor, FlgM [Deltaproteobacteria bacterium ADurb.Bin026]HNQ63731.1 flagellar biosynthesis anti-sigma factor FlgM [Syntrophorhabdaceae bacterium]HOF58619.1 flagellar biosynthesis anti-sigma factor FlgM [Syntrophorhabdaceae bacterium]